MSLQSSTLSLSVFLLLSRCTRAPPHTRTLTSPLPRIRDLLKSEKRGSGHSWCDAVCRHTHKETQLGASSRALEQTCRRQIHALALRVIPASRLIILYIWFQLQRGVPPPSRGTFAYAVQLYMYRIQDISYVMTAGWTQTYSFCQSVGWRQLFI